MPEQIDQLYSSYDRNLYRITGDEQDDAIWNMIQSSQSSGSTGTTMVIGGGGSLGDSSIDPSTTVVAVGSIQSGKKVFDNTVPGYILGFDPKDGKAKFYIGNSSQYLNFDGTTLTVAGDFLIGSSNLTIGTTDNIQTAINQLNTAGGGQLYLQQGTYMVTSSLTLYSNVSIFGQSPSDTTIVLTNGAQLTMTGTGIYTTGTISSISGGVNVTGSGTTWTSAMIGQQIFINNRWYVISNVTSTTTLVLATGYADGTTFSGTYRIVSPIHDVEIKNITVTGSSATALTGTDVRDITFYGLVFASNNKGFSLTNFMDIEVTILTCASNTSNGYELTSGSFFNASQLASVSNGGHGAVINTMKSSGIIFSACDANTNDGFNLTTATNCVFKVEASGNGGQGVEMVTGCNYNFINDALIQNNTSDGIRLTASSSSNTFGSSIAISGNGGYGINFVDSTSTNNNVIVPSFSTNTSGNINDLGLNTNIIWGNPVNAGAQFIASTTIAAGKVVKISAASAGGLIIIQAGVTLNTGVHLTDPVSSQAIAQTFTTVGPVDVGGIGGISTVNTPTDNLVCTVYNDAGTAPGTTVIGTVSVNRTQLASAGQLAFTTPLHLSASTVYWFVFTRSGASDGTNYWFFERNNSNEYAGGAYYTFNGSTWSSTAFDLVMDLESSVSQIPLGLAGANDGVKNGTDYFGFAQSSATLGQALTVQTEGIVSGLSGLVPGQIYYLSNTAGNISTTPGVNTKKLGYALTTTAFYVLLV